MYTAEGIRTISRGTIPWDEVRKVRIHGKSVVRHVMHITEDKIPLPAAGVGGVKRHDIGRILVVDRYPDGQWIDAFALPGQKIMTTREERTENMIKTAQIAAKYSKEPPHKIATLVGVLFTTAHKLHRYDLIETSERVLTAWEKKNEEELTKTFVNVARQLGATKVVFGDPRGYTMKVHWPGNESNDWGGEDWGIE
jgi:hypothetical protein